MISEKEIKTLLKAKRDRLAINILMVMSAICLTLLVFFEVTQITNKYTILLATLSLVFMGTSAGANKWVSVSREDLINALENIVHKDPNAIKLLAEHQNHRNG